MTHSIEETKEKILSVIGGDVDWNEECRCFEVRTDTYNYKRIVNALVRNLDLTFRRLVNFYSYKSGNGHDLFLELWSYKLNYRIRIDCDLSSDLSLPSVSQILPVAADIERTIFRQNGVRFVPTEHSNGDMNE